MILIFLAYHWTEQICIYKLCYQNKNKPQHNGSNISNQDTGNFQQSVRSVRVQTNKNGIAKPDASLSPVFRNPAKGFYHRHDMTT